MALCSIENIETYLNSTISDSNPSYDSALEKQYQMIIDAVSKEIENICGRTFNETTYTEYHDGERSDRIYSYATIDEITLEQYPITSLTSVTYRDSVQDLDDVIIYYDEGTLAFDFIVSGRQTLKVVYSAGFNPIPDDLNMICIEEVVRSVNSTTQNSNLRSEKLGEKTLSYFSSAENKELLTQKLDSYIRLDT